MTKNKKSRDHKIIPIDAIDDADRWIIAAGAGKDKFTRRIRGFARSRGGCHFGTGIPVGLANFIYRAAMKLGLAGRVVFFARGVVREGGRMHVRGVSVREIEWDVGTLVTISRAVKYGDHVTLEIENSVHSLRFMELLVLGALLRIAHPRGSQAHHASMAALILARGWKALPGDTNIRVRLVSDCGAKDTE